LMNTPPRITELAKRFEDNLDAYKSGKYKETQLRREFIDPLFEELGWDVQNRQGYAEAYKDVIHEDAVKIGGYTKAPDYCFRIGGVRKFFLEAKRPSTDVKDDISPAYQLRRYAWSAKLPLSILTDFEEFAIYDCRVKPGRTDKASTARTIYMTFDEYTDRWDEIAGVFSRDAILKGSFDKYVQSSRLKRGTAEVDNAFLEEIERWRSLLARNIALRNPGLSQRDLNFAVQRSIDRIIFLRICEDRGIESYGELMALQNGPHAYRRLFELFRKADDRYNSGLFHFRAEKERPGESIDTLTSNINVDDKVLRDIIKNLYYPDSPYEFSVLPADILGQVYERFLGSVIRLTSGHRAVVEEKPEVRKAGGVYYTPTYIVNYIVKNTVGELVNGKKPGPRGAVSNLRILDPACGSGSFLLGAYQYLLDWHRDEYAKENPEKWAKGRKPRLYQGPGGEWKLTTDERKRILLNNIYGVDIDSQAVEVTKLSLLLKVLEGENQETIESQLRLFRERALPDLSNNIKCGNSLIGPDFYEGKQIGLLDNEEIHLINAFDWNAEFPEIVNSGGFNAVIGNPPYGMMDDERARDYYGSSYLATEGRLDHYELFIERGLQLSAERGFLGFIIPSPFLTNVYARELRRHLLAHTAIHEIVNFGIRVFAGPTVHTCIIIVSKGKQRRGKTKIRKQVREVADLGSCHDYLVPQGTLGDNPNVTFDIFLGPATRRLVRRLGAGACSLGDICHIRQCIKTGDDARFVRNAENHPGRLWKPTLRGRSIRRYTTIEKDIYVKYGPWLARNWKNRTFYETPKIVVRETGWRIIATLDLEHRFVLSSLYAIYPRLPTESVSLHYILGILNSKMATFYMKKVALQLTEGAFSKFRTNQIARLPIQRIDMAEGRGRAIHDRIVALVKDILLLSDRLAEAGNASSCEQLRRQISSYDTQIDEAVYELYRLDDKSIRMIETEFAEDGRG